MCDSAHFGTLCLDGAKEKYVRITINFRSRSKSTPLKVNSTIPGTMGRGLTMEAPHPAGEDPEVCAATLKSMFIFATTISTVCEICRNYILKTYMFETLIYWDIKA